MRQFQAPPAPEQWFLSGSDLADTGTVFVIMDGQTRVHPTYGPMVDFLIVQLAKPVENTRPVGILSLQLDESRKTVLDDLRAGDEPLGPVTVTKVRRYLRLTEGPAVKDDAKLSKLIAKAVADNAKSEKPVSLALANGNGVARPTATVQSQLVQGDDDLPL